MSIQISQFNRSTTLEVVRRANQLLGQLGAEFGIKLGVDPGSVQFNQDAVVFKAKAKVGRKSREQLAFERLAPRFGLGVGDYRMAFKYGGHDYFLVGFHVHAVKYLFAALRKRDGKVCRLPSWALPVVAARGGYSPSVIGGGFGENYEHERDRPF